MKQRIPVIETHAFAAKDFVGGDAALDFVNTVTGRDQTPRDWLDDYPRLLEWTERAELLPVFLLRALAKLARANSGAATEALQRAKHLREALFSIINGMISGKTPPESAIALLNEHWQAGVAAHELRYEKRNVWKEISTRATNLDLVASMVAYRFVQNVLSEPQDRLRMCEGHNCAWVFLDRSKAGRRRWCDMAVCGNAAKSRRFQARAKRKRRQPVASRSQPR